MTVDKTNLTIQFNVDAVAQELDAALQDLVNTATTAIEKEVARLTAMGMSRQAIKEKLMADLDAGTGVFGTLINGAGRVASDGVNMMNQAAYYGGIVRDMKELYRWILDPGAKHCDDCLDRATWPAMSFGDWQDAGLPGSGVTACTHNCRCSLVPVDVLED